MLGEMQQVAARRPLDGPSLFFGIKQQFQIVNIRLATKERRAKLFVVCVCNCVQGRCRQNESGALGCRITHAP